MVGSIDWCRLRLAMARTVRPGGRSTELCLSFSGHGRAGHTGIAADFSCRPITILCQCSRKGSSHADERRQKPCEAMGPWPLARTGPDRVSHGSVGPDRQAIINAVLAPPQHYSSHQLWPPPASANAWRGVSNGRSEEQRIEDRERERELCRKISG
jgi:hypothetical protein